MSSPAERRLSARIAANARWAGESDRAAATVEARRNGPGSIEYWMAKVDPDSQMSVSDRRQAAQNKKTEFYLRLSLKAAQARSARARRT